MEYIFVKIENIMGKWENAGYQFLLPFPQNVSMYLRVIKIRACGNG